MTQQQTKQKKFYEQGEHVKVKGTDIRATVIKVIPETLSVLVSTYKGDGFIETELKLWQIDKLKEQTGKQPLKIHIKYFDETLPKIEKLNIGDWIDLRAAQDVSLQGGQFGLIPLGVAMALPKGYEANVVPRSSTYKNFKILQTNHYGVIDESYRGNDDQWFFPAYALEDTVIKKGDRICQFRIQRKMPEVQFVEVEQLTDPNRGGHGSTGTK